LYSHSAVHFLELSVSFKQTFNKQAIMNRLVMYLTSRQSWTD